MAFAKLKIIFMTDKDLPFAKPHMLTKSLTEASELFSAKLPYVNIVFHGRILRRI